MLAATQMGTFGIVVSAAIRCKDARSDSLIHQYACDYSDSLRIAARFFHMEAAASADEIWDCAYQSELNRTGRWRPAKAPLLASVQQHLRAPSQFHKLTVESDDRT